MRVLSPEETCAALPFDRLIDALDAGLAQDVCAPPRHHHAMGGPDGDRAVLLLMPAWRDKGWGGVKLVNAHPANAARGLAAISATYVLFERETGRHRLILDGAALTARRTAAVAALAAKRLARPDSKKLLLLGAGRVAAAAPWAYRAALPIAEIAVWSRREESAERLAATLRDQGLDARARRDLPQAVAEADLIAAATLAQEPILKGDWLQPGCHLDLIGSFTPQMREADDAALRRARIFVDTDHALCESGELKIPLETGAIDRRAVEASLPELCRGDLYPRRSAQEITLFKSVGAAPQDLAAAILAAEALAAEALAGP